MGVIIAIMVFIVLICLLTMWIAIKLIRFNGKRVKKFKIMGELMITVSAIIFFVMGTGSMDDDTSTTDYVIESKLDKIAGKLDEIDRNQVASRKDRNSSSVKDPLSFQLLEIEKSVRYEMMQIQTVKLVAGIIALSGSVLLFVGKFGEFKIGL